MSEYSALLIDQLITCPHSGIVNLGEQTVPASLLEYYSQEQPTAQHLAQATMDMLQTTLFSKGLKHNQGDFENAMRDLIEQKRLRVWKPQDRTIGQFARELESTVFKGNLGNSS